MEVLYKKDSKGEILQWSAKTVQNAQGISIAKYHGKFDGKITVEFESNIQGKNIGKSNETSPQEQADSILESLYRLKKRRGYKSLTDLKYDFGDGISSTINIGFFLKSNLKYDTTDDKGNLKPMLAQQYFRSKKDWKAPDGTIWSDRKYYYLKNPYAPKEPNAIIIKFPCLIQPKINGVRCSIFKNDSGIITILSKDGLEYNLPHIVKDFIDNDYPFTLDINGEEIDIIYDGELYIHGELLQTISSAVKAENLNTRLINFVCFDLSIPKLNNLDRYLKLKEIIGDRVSLTTQIEKIRTYKVSNDLAVQELTDKFISEGYEGSILRDPKAIYAFGKRPMTMVKLKRCIDEEFEIVDIVPQAKNPSLGLYVCRTKEGKEFEVTPKGDEAFKEMLLLLKSDYIGKKLTCSFYEYTKDDKPFHVIDNLIRDYE